MNVYRLIAILVAILSMVSCHTLPPPVEKQVMVHVAPAKHGAVARAAKEMSRSHRTALVSLESSKDALESRLALIDSAEQSLDIQLFIWMEDYTGRVMMERVLMAADRGVKVRILLDDLVLGIAYNDRELSAIASHPNVELRLYNPNRFRDRIPIRAWDLLVRTSHSNQRMHNKTIIADGVMAIISGRNIGDHYFGYGDRYNLVDFGAMLAGPVVSDMSRGFDRYWNSDPTYDVRAFTRSGRHMSLVEFRAKALEKIRRKKVTADRSISIVRKDWKLWFKRAAQRAHDGQAVYLEDAPEVPSGSRPVIEEIIQRCSQSRKEIILVTPYLVPDQRIMRMIRQVRSRGVRVVLIVPTVASNNHLIVHNQYQKYRQLLLRLGVEIFEFKHRPRYEMSPFIYEGDNDTHKVGLHAKLVIIDSRVTYMGSMNFDGRAMFVNTEEGVIIRSRALAEDLKNWTRLLMHPENAWRLGLDEKGKIVWISGKISRTHEPSLDFVQATLEFFLRPFAVRHSIFPDKGRESLLKIQN